MQLDGPDLEELLLRAREEYGSDVRIVKADKVRTGGVGGFFAREQYELSIEVDEPLREPPAASAKSTGRPASLLDLADAISDRETQQRPTPPRATTSPLADPTTFTPGISTAPSRSAGPALSTDGASFASILAGLTASVAEPSPPPSASRIIDQPATTTPKPAQEPTATQKEAEPVVRPSLSRPPATRRRTETRPARRSRAETAPAAISLQSLRDLGMPDTLLPSRSDGDVLGALVSALRRLPTPPTLPMDAGDVVAVVGEGEGAWDAAVQLTHSVGLDDRALVYLTAGTAPSKIAPARRITALDQLPSRLDRWRKRTTPTVAVIDTPMSVKAARWNRQALTVLRPAAVWVVVPATRKTADVGQWIGRIGKTDGLVITDVDASSDPASVLELGVPVAWLDGRPATPGAWAGLIVDRLVEAR